MAPMFPDAIEAVPVHHPLDPVARTDAIADVRGVLERARRPGGVE